DVCSSDLKRLLIYSSVWSVIQIRSGGFAFSYGGFGQLSGGTHRGDVYLLVLAHDPNKIPTLQPRLRRAFDNLDRVADMRFIILIMHVAHGPTMNELAVLRMLDQAANLHAPALVHFVAGDDAN